MKEQETFQILADYLSGVGDEVEGRSLDEMPEEVARMMKSFAAGGLPEAERVELAELLKRNPGWVSVLAGEAKALRPTGEEGS